MFVYQSTVCCRYVLEAKLCNATTESLQVRDTLWHTISYKSPTADDGSVLLTGSYGEQPLLRALLQHITEYLATRPHESTMRVHAGAEFAVRPLIPVTMQDSSHAAAATLHNPVQYVIHIVVDPLVGMSVLRASLAVVQAAVHQFPQQHIDLSATNRLSVLKQTLYHWITWHQAIELVADFRLQAENPTCDSLDHDVLQTLCDKYRLFLLRTSASLKSMLMTSVLTDSSSHDAADSIRKGEPGAAPVTWEQLAGEDELMAHRACAMARRYGYQCDLTMADPE
jgi:hypothetical protein